MNSLGQQGPSIDASKLSDSDKRELQQFVSNEIQKNKIQDCMPSLNFPVPPSIFTFCLPLKSCSLVMAAIHHPQIFHWSTDSLIYASLAVHNLTDICWKKCVTGSIKSGKLDRSEESCAQNCVDRFLDANDTVLRHLSEMKGQS